MHYLFYLGHPAHFHLFKNVITHLKLKNHRVSILIKKKDVLENLLIESGLEYKNILPEGRNNHKISIGFGLLKRDYRMLLYSIKNKPDLMIGTSPEITHIGKILNIKSIVVNEDDAEQVPLFAKLSYPFTNCILAPVSCSTGKWKNKTIFYEGYHELTYLHPNYFTPSKLGIKNLVGDGIKEFFIIRFAKLSAHHDNGITGISTEIAEKLINILSPYGNVFITSERELEPQFEKYRISIKSSEMHNAMFYASMFIGDSQTMAAEAAVLGTPSIRFNDFVGKLGYLEELEQKFMLTFGIKTTEPEKLFAKVTEILSNTSIKLEWCKRKEKMLSHSLDVNAFMIWFFENFPHSYDVMKSNPELKKQFCKQILEAC